MRTLDVYERRAEIMALIKKKPMATSNIAKKLGQPVNAVIHDINIMRKRKWVVEAGKDEVLYPYGAKRYTAWKALVVMTERQLELDALGKQASIYDDAAIPDLPESLLMMMGYNTKPKPKGRFIDNADFHPTPTRTAPVRVYPGTSWVHMEMAL